MTALNIRDIGAERKAALEAEARAEGVPVAEIVRRFVDEGVARARAARAQEAWVASARDALAFEADKLDTEGPTLASFRHAAGG
ncbi:hypothetical protein ABMC89_18530 [Sulfitobacter sp. HNIBRBA3233]|uniref:hypothetical protein n=1 Tax=Sulfitobacter marinivivus TaxID=3158558 RepID=UPI0032DF2A62